jgi:predicted nucleic acid-binding protein
MILDTSVLLAAFDTDERLHKQAKAIVESASGRLVVSSFVLAELDYLLLTRHGAAREVVVLTELAQDPWDVVSLGRDELRQAVSLVEKHVDDRIGLTDAANLVLAMRYRTRYIATFDWRHFAALRFPDGAAVELPSP